MKTTEEVEVLLEGLDENNISSVLKKWREISMIKKKIEEIDDMLKIKVKTYLKEREWDKYQDKDTNISVSISTIKRQTFDKAQLKIMLTEAQYAQVVQTNTYEKMSIITPEARERLKNYARKQKRVPRFV